MVIADFSKLLPQERNINYFWIKQKNVIKENTVHEKETEV